MKGFLLKVPFSLELITRRTQLVIIIAQIKRIAIHWIVFAPWISLIKKAITKLAQPAIPKYPKPEIDGEIYEVMAFDNGFITKGAKVVVVDVEGETIYVERI